MTDRDLMQQALDAMEFIPECGSMIGHVAEMKRVAAVAALRDRLAQPEKEPVAWSKREIELIDGMIEVQLKHARTCDSIANRTMADKQKGWDLERVTLLEKIKASAPPQRPWVGLTDEEIETFVAHLYPLPEKPVRERLRVLEAKLREKNT